MSTDDNRLILTCPHGHRWFDVGPDDDLGGALSIRWQQRDYRREGEPSPTEGKFRYVTKRERLPLPRPLTPDLDDLHPARTEGRVIVTCRCGNARADIYDAEWCYRRGLRGRNILRKALDQG